MSLAPTAIPGDSQVIASWNPYEGENLRNYTIELYNDDDSFVNSGDTTDTTITFYNLING